jgi:DNA-binding response OmpR family regulator
MKKESKYKILVVDDQLYIRKILSKRLKILGYEVLTTQSGEEAIKLCNFFSPDLIILDIMLNGINGYEVCYKIRSSSNVPIIFISALDKLTNQLKGFEMGGNDFIIKPFSIDEIEEKIMLRLKEQNNKQKSTIKVYNFEINFAKQILIKNSQTFLLTTTETKFLKVFLLEKNKILTRKTIINRVWGFNYSGHIDIRIVDVYISKLRLKIEDDPTNPRILKTIRGIGYKFYF